jgi:hypothetical protein
MEAVRTAKPSIRMTMGQVAMISDGDGWEMTAKIFLELAALKMIHPGFMTVMRLACLVVIMVDGLPGKMTLELMNILLP